MINESACLGVSILGQCSYDPQKPTYIFTIGQLASVLSILVAFSQFTKAIQRFRIECNGFRGKLWIYALACTSAFVIISNTLPFIPGNAIPLFGYPVFWELAGGTLLIVAILNHISVVFESIKLTPKNCGLFLTASWDIIRKGDQSDLTDYAREISGNIRIAHKILIDRIDRDDKDDWSENETSAYTLFQLWSDTALCRVIAEKFPNITKEFVECADSGLPSDIGGRMFEQILTQSIQYPTSMFNRNYGSIAHSLYYEHIDSIFSNVKFLASNYDPLNSFPLDVEECNEKSIKYFVKCFESAIKATYRRKDIGLIPHGKIADAFTKLNQVFMNEVFSENRSKSADGKWKTTFYIASFYSDLILELNEIEYVEAQKNLIKVCSKAYSDYFSWVSRIEYRESSHYTMIYGLWNSLYSRKMARNAIVEQIAKAILDELNKIFERNFGNGLLKFPPITRFYLNIYGFNNEPSHNDEKADDPESDAMRDFVLNEIKSKFASVWESDPGFAKRLLPEFIDYDPATKILRRTNPLGQVSEFCVD